MMPVVLMYICEAPAVCSGVDHDQWQCMNFSVLAHMYVYIVCVGSDMGTLHI